MNGRKPGRPKCPKPPPTPTFEERLLEALHQIRDAVFNQPAGEIYAQLARILANTETIMVEAEQLARDLKAGTDKLAGYNIAQNAAIERVAAKIQRLIDGGGIPPAALAELRSAKTTLDQVSVSEESQQSQLEAMGADPAEPVPNVDPPPPITPA